MTDRFYSHIFELWNEFLSHSDSYIIANSVWHVWQRIHVWHWKLRQKWHGTGFQFFLLWIMAHLTSFIKELNLSLSNSCYSAYYLLSHTKWHKTFSTITPLFLDEIIKHKICYPYQPWPIAFRLFLCCYSKATELVQNYIRVQNSDNKYNRIDFNRGCQRCRFSRKVPLLFYFVFNFYCISIFLRWKAYFTIFHSIIRSGL